MTSFQATSGALWGPTWGKVWNTFKVPQLAKPGGDAAANIQWTLAQPGPGSKCFCLVAVHLKSVGQLLIEILERKENTTKMVEFPCFIFSWLLFFLVLRSRWWLLPHEIVSASPFWIKLTPWIPSRTSRHMSFPNTTFLGDSTWLVTETILKNDGVKVNGKDDIPYKKWTIKKWNHQPGTYDMYLKILGIVKQNA